MLYLDYFMIEDGSLHVAILIVIVIVIYLFIHGEIHSQYLI